uniref:Uncharacterized protein n=1 Tax=Avena sativa TaxID=4498 RepID=A0ACD5XKU0_AVESA
MPLSPSPAPMPASPSSSSSHADAGALHRHLRSPTLLVSLPCLCPLASAQLRSPLRLLRLSVARVNTSQQATNTSPTMTKLVFLPILLSFLLPFSSLALTQDFCVANLLLSKTPAGFPCKPAALVTADDFYFSGATPPVKIDPFNISFVPAYVPYFPGINGLSLSGVRVFLGTNGVVPLHSVPRANEIIFVVKGTLMAGFITSNSNVVYTKKLSQGDIFLFPQGLVRFFYNVGNTTAEVFGVFSNQNPGIQITDYALFGNILPAEVVEKVTYIDDAKVQRLKLFFGPRTLGA